MRIIAATNRDLYDELNKGTFREDLYYRLNVIEIRMPSLRERPDDIPRLSRHILKRLCQKLNIKECIEISEEAMNCLCCYNWPGNVRELQNAIERAIVYIEGDGIITCDCLSPRLKKSMEIDGSIKEYEKIAILQAIAKHKGNITKTAEELGIHRSTLYIKMKKLGISH